MTDGAPRAETIAPRVLVVDDYRDGADSLVLMLRALGAEAQAAYDGDVALRLAEAFQPNLVLLDLGLPGGATGVDVGRAILAQARVTPRVVAVSGSSHQEARQACRDAGFTGFLVKPVALEAITALLDGRGGGPSPEPDAPQTRHSPA
jgi:CheY-like chemotaxis protein